MNLHTCVKFGPDRSSGLRQDRRWLLSLVRFLAAVGAHLRKNMPKKQHLYMSSAQIMGTESVAYTPTNKGSCFQF